MLKEIKFRAWDKKLKKMYRFDQGVWLCGEYQSLAFSVNPDDIGEDKGHYYLSFDFDDLEIMQFIGLKDKNGKEIYEGDILSGMGVVEWVETDCRFGMNILGELKEVEFWELSQSDLEVIGNIYENPELVEE